ncbi:LysR substrate-binding domain-containing protein [Aestuariivirga sp. YIM B02566]|uniref:LysR family transcriptional regulator n=1 Tax=Taklimakanibacter albus TaxID=2800327 RepID=A0ACC5QZ03_9HYPH|nr:LysR substrate-binding domain-containing protein [Aestuariivirga sp. YIM B02566]MBK1865629.1 LysR family transcriptional regulator [Aestuariivirga sp. YIM B02566]
MRYAQLKAFHAVAANGGFSKAAERLALTQPAISDHIRKLEDAYGSELFLRRRGGVELTAFARKLFAVTERMFEAETEALELLSRAKGLEEGLLSIGADAATHVLPLIRRFRERYPKIQVRLVAGNSAQLLARLDRFEIDFAVIAEAPPQQDYHARLLREDDIQAFSAATHPFARRQEISLADFVAQPVVLREEGSATRGLLLAEIASRALVLTNVMEIESREAAREAVASGMGIGVISSAEIVPDARLHMLRFSDWQARMSEWLVCLTARADLHIIRAVLGLLRR